MSDEIDLDVLWQMHVHIYDTLNQIVYANLWEVFKNVEAPESWNIITSCNI